MVELEYAKALFDLSLEQKRTEEYLEYLNEVKQIIEQNKEFHIFLISPLIEIKEKIKCVQNVFKTADKIMLNFLCVLVENFRFNLLENILEEYQKILLEYNSILNVKVTSSTLLSKIRVHQITKILEKKYPNKKIKIENVVDPKNSYGLQIFCNGKNLDVSLKTRLDGLKKSL